MILIAKKDRKCEPLAAAGVLEFVRESHPQNRESGRQSEPGDIAAVKESYRRRRYIRLGGFEGFACGESGYFE